MSRATSKKDIFSGLLGREPQSPEKTTNLEDLPTSMPVIDSEKDVPELKETQEQPSKILPINNDSSYVKRTKATFELPSELHTRLKLFAVSRQVRMVDVVEQALIDLLDKNNG